MAALKRTVQAVISASLLCAAFGMAWAQVNPAGVSKWFAKQEAEPMSMTAGEFASFVWTETDKIGRLVKISGARIE